jgi:pimeloyl-ACP methyl ester carboxylesterase
VVCAVVLGALGLSQLPRSADAVADLGPAVSCSLEAPWTCHRLKVPARRSAAADPSATIDLLYAVRPAAHPLAGRRHVLVLVDGGPGASGIDDADWTAKAFGRRVTDAEDIVAFDARGTGGTDAHDCSRAGRAYTQQPVDAVTARRFADDCLREVNLAADELPRFGSAEIAEDIDAIRAAMGADRMTVYGSSYGTVIAQAYAAAHPDRLDGLILDAPIDRSLPAPQMWVQAARGFDAVIDETFKACAADEDCHAALPDPQSTLDSLYRQIAAGGDLEATILDGNGEKDTYGIYREDLAAVVDAAMYGPGKRMLLLRALAAARRGDDSRLLRLVASIASGRASFAYFATWCADTRVSATAQVDDFAGLSAYIEDAHVPSTERETALALAPCLFWPGQPSTWSPPAESSTVPMLILTSTGDPITRPELAHAIASRHPEARLIETKGGAHGSLGEPCADERLADFIVNGKLPLSVQSACTEDLMFPFLPLAPSPAGSGGDAGLGIFWELFGTPEVLQWDGTGDLDLGCGDEGRIRLDGADSQGHSTITFEGCQWATNARFDGDGWIDNRGGQVDFTLRSPNGELHVTSDGRSAHVTGTWRGTEVDQRW